MNHLHHRLNEIQKEASEKALEELRLFGKTLIVMTTGTGKTILGMKIIREGGFKKVLWLTQIQELIRQTEEDFVQFFGREKVGLCQRNQQDRDCPYLLASVQTLTLDRWLHSYKPDEFDLLIIDEAHHSMASSWKKIIDYFKAPKIGLTATPKRRDEKDIGELFGNHSFFISYEEAKQQKLIAEETYRMVLTNSVLEGLPGPSGDYSAYQLDRLVTSLSRNDVILESYLKYGRTFLRENRLPLKTICFCLNVRHAFFMRDFFRNAGISSDILVSLDQHNQNSKTCSTRQFQSTQERKSVFHDFLKGKGCEILCVVNILNEGKNIPDVGCLLFLRPTNSATIYQQQVGRGCRRIEGKKEKFMILDFVDLPERMSRTPSPFSFFKWTGKLPDYSSFILDFYRGRDPVILDTLIDYVSPFRDLSRQPLWTKETIKEALLSFYSKKKKPISYSDLTFENNLPGRGHFTHFWPNLGACLKECGIPSIPKNKSWSQKEICKKLKTFYKEKGSIRITDLGFKNNLPSQKVIQDKWGSWTKCALDIGFDLKKVDWTRQKIKKSFLNFKKKHGRFPGYPDLHSRNDLPSYTMLSLKMGPIPKVLNELFDISLTSKRSNKLPPGVQQSSTSRFRSEIYIHGKRKYLGSFKTAEEASFAYQKAKKEKQK